MALVSDFGQILRKFRQVPEQLPDDLQDFSGRDEQPNDVEKLFSAGEVQQGVVVVSAIAGMGGSARPPSAFTSRTD